MRKWPLVTAIILLVAWLPLERKAALLGASWLAPELPHNLEPHRFNGLTLFKYAEWDGDFAVAPFYKLNEQDGVVEAEPAYGYPTGAGRYVRIQRYSFNKDLYAEFASWDQGLHVSQRDAKRYYFLIDGTKRKDSSDQDVKVMDVAAFEKTTGEKIANSRWVSVQNTGAWLLAVVIIRFALAASLVLAIWFSRGQKKNHASQPL